jgi:hypothetical protein
VVFLFLSASFLLSFFIFSALGFELWASHLVGKHSTLEPFRQLFFVMSDFEIGSHELFAQGWL